MGRRMDKYDLQLDLDSINSTSIIINMIKPNSRILEFGPAYGRLTKYLNEKLECKVDIVEIDQQAGIEAGKYAVNKCIGEKYGDANKLFWCEKLNGEQYDYIIFEDVLEHLWNAEVVLAKAGEKLSVKGSILVSLPNVAHASIIVQLYNNQFEYKDLGLLDNSHVKFFTYYSFKSLIEKLGFESVKEEATFCETANTEFSVSLYDVPREVAKALLKNEFANVYQFIFEIKKKRDVTLSFKLKDINLDIQSKYFCQCYWSNSDYFSEKES